MTICFRRVTAALLIAFTVSLGYGELVPDDHGNSVLTATPLFGSSHSLTGTLEYDTDVDVFSFPFKPWTSYMLSVEIGTVLGVEIEVIPPSGAGSVWQANSVWEDAAVVDDAYHQGASARWYLVVRPLFQFTTGTYHLTIHENPGQDTDGDGFPDAWELHYFGDLDTADSDVHADAFRTGRAPNDPLVVDSIQPSPDGHVVGWTAAPYGTYDIYTTTHLLHEVEWELLGTHVAGPDGGVIHWIHAPSADPIRFYQIRFRVE